MLLIVRPAVFNVGFGVSSLTVCSIWQYENMREEALRAKQLGYGWPWTQEHSRYNIIYPVYDFLIINQCILSQEGW